MISATFPIVDTMAERLTRPVAIGIPLGAKVRISMVSMSVFGFLSSVILA